MRQSVYMKDGLIPAPSYGAGSRSPGRVSHHSVGAPAMMRANENSVKKCSVTFCGIKNDSASMGYARNVHVTYIPAHKKIAPTEGGASVADSQCR
jgi:hypothetical protein